MDEQCRIPITMPLNRDFRAAPERLRACSEGCSARDRIDRDDHLTRGWRPEPQDFALLW